MEGRRYGSQGEFQKSLSTKITKGNFWGGDMLLPFLGLAQIMTRGRKMQTRDYNNEVQAHTCNLNTSVELAA